MTENVFESQLFELETMLFKIAAASEWTGDSSHIPDSAPLDTACAPGSELADGAVEVGLLTDGGAQAEMAELALALCTRLILSWKLRKTAFKLHPEAEALLRAERRFGCVDRVEDVDPAEVMRNVPWLLRKALTCLLDDSEAIDNNPAGGPATVARILASMLDVLERGEDMRKEPRDTTHPAGIHFSAARTSRQRH
ncbi:MAG: hypothetical protein ACR2RL_06980 [Gammaproteobacteria bacterium]